MTIEQVRQIVAGARDLHRSDDAVVQQLSDVKLTERLTGSALQQLVAASPGPRTIQAIHAIADESAFLDPPPAELPGTPTPVFAIQKAIMGRAIDYVVHTMPALPNLVATRITEHYVDSLRGLENQTSEPRGELFFLGMYRAPIAFNNGRETDDPALAATLAAADKKQLEADANGASLNGAILGMSSWGEFGPVLGVILVDAAKGKLGWARWQLENGKPVAVFQFSVDRSISQYRLNYCCESNGGSFLSGSTRSYAGSNYHAATPNLIAITAGYHGKLEIDPDTGAVLRITIEADLRPDDPIQRASMMVEYAPIDIGGSTRICPSRSVSLSVSRAQLQSHGAVAFTDRLLLNDVRFVDYHRFGSESTLITQALPVPDQPNPSASNPASSPAQSVSSSTVASAGQGSAAPPAPVPPSSGAALSAAAPPASPASAPAASASANAEPSGTVLSGTMSSGTMSSGEIETHPADSLPGMASDAASPAAGSPAGFTLKVTTRSVDVGLIATDKHGKPIPDLRQDQVDLFDNGRRQQLTAFHHAAQAPGAAKSASAQPAQPADADTFTNAPPENPQSAEVLDTLILLMDESHLAFQDLNQARQEVLRFLNASQSSSPVALYAINERQFRILQDITRDHALLARKLAAWTPDIGAVAHAQELDRRNRQQFDEVHNAQDLQSVNGNQIDSPMTVETTDPELRQMGDNPLGYVLETMMALSRHLASIPGHKSLVWIAGDSVLSDWQDKAVGADKGSTHLETALLHAREALNEANIALYAVDAGAIVGNAVDASLQHQNVQLNQASMDTATLTGAGTPGGAGSNGNGGVPMGRNTAPGRITAQMQQDEHVIQGPIRDLAQATGGRAVNKGSDLKSTLDAISRDSGGLYELGFSPDTAADNKFHALQVKTPGRKDIVLRYRSGYLYTEETASTRQRFQQAVWSPQDATGISLTAEAVSAADAASGPPTIRLRIAFPGLALEQKDGRWTDNLYIFIAQRDDATQKAEVSGDTLRLALQQATYASGMPAGIPYQRAVDVKSRLGSVRVIVIDGNSGRIGSVTLPSSALHP